jgi:hypothetical protein
MQNWVLFLAGNDNFGAPFKLINYSLTKIEQLSYIFQILKNVPHFWNIQKCAIAAQGWIMCIFFVKETVP